MTILQNSDMVLLLQPYLCPPPKGRGTYCMDVALGHDEELIRFW